MGDYGVFCVSVWKTSIYCEEYTAMDKLKALWAKVVANEFVQKYKWHAAVAVVFFVLGAVAF